MKTLGLIAQKFAYFCAVLFLGSFFLVAFLWVSPASPGRPRDDVIWDAVELGSTVVCKEFDSGTCGPLKSLPSGSPPSVAFLASASVDPAQEDLEVLESSSEGSLVRVREDWVKLPGPRFNQWFFADFWGGLTRGDVGLAGKEFERAPALSVVLEGSRYTLPLVFATLIVAVLLALGLTAFLTWLPFPSLRGAIRAVLLVISITPVFILGYILQENGVLDTGTVTLTVLVACTAVLCLGDSNLGEMLLQFETEFRNLRSRDYIHAARLRGASEFKHMLPGLLLPISSVSASKVASPYITPA